MILDTITNWFNISKQYFFSYKDGFFRLSYLSNSPELIVNSTKRLPFLKFDDEKQILFTDNPFVKGALRYLELENGLWLMNSKMNYKNNISYSPIYDSNVPADYYCITINTVENHFNSDFYEFNNFKVENQSITFLKPKKDFINCHFKGAYENQYIIYFNKAWAQKNLLNATKVPDTLLKLCNNPDIGFINFKYKKFIYDRIVENYAAIFDNQQKLDFFKLKKNTFEFFEVFLSTLEDMGNLELNKLKLKERLVMQNVENYMMEHIYDKFLGIEVLANLFKMSPTKLKKNFKIVYGQSIFNYFQTKQMHLVMQILKTENVLIKEVAEKFNYENISKFSKTFEKVHDILPSKLSRD